MRVLMVPAVLGLGVAVACSTEPSGDVAGSWTLDAMIASQTGISCALEGELLIGAGDDLSRFIGSFIVRTQDCSNTTPAGFILTGNDPIFNGRVRGSEVTFEANLCKFEGEIVGDTMSGTWICPDGTSGQVVELTGTWSANRILN